jgi:hypothetical protein
LNSRSSFTSLAMKENMNKSGLCSIQIHCSLELVCELWFVCCTSLTSLTFEGNSRLSPLEKETFSGSGLNSIHIPWSVEVICESCFSSCNSLNPLPLRQIRDCLA